VLDGLVRSIRTPIALEKYRDDLSGWFDGRCKEEEF